MKGLARRRINMVVPQVIWPRYVDVVDTIPVTDQGSSDRDAIAAMLASMPQLQTRYSAPATSTEQAVADAFTHVVGVERPSMNDEMVQLGATSMAFLHLAAHIGTTLRVNVGARELNDVTTLRELAAVVEKAAPARISTRSMTDEASSMSGEAIAVGEDPVGHVQYRPTPAQEEIWLLARADPSGLAASLPRPQRPGRSPLDLVYHLSVHLALAVGITADTAREALMDVFARHEALRTVYPDEGGAPMALVRGVGEVFATPPVTAGSLTVAGIERAVVSSFDLAVDAPWRAVLDTSGDTIELLLVAHHIAIDEWSLPLVFADFAVAVQARQAGHEPTWPSDAPGFSSVLAARENTAPSGIYWTRKLRRAPEHLALPAPATTESTGLTGGPAVYLRHTISSDLRGRATEVARSAGTTLNTLLSLALAAALGNYTDTDDIVLSIPFAGRETSDELQTVGMFVQTAPLRITGVRDLAVSEALTRVAKDIDDARRHAATAPSGLADVIFAYHAGQPDLSATGVIVDYEVLPTYQARTALEFSVVDNESELEVTLTVAEKHVDVVAAEHILDRFIVTVAGLVAGGGDALVSESVPVPELPVRTDRRTVLVDPIEALLAHAEDRPHAGALVAGEDRLTYQQLVTRARDLADRLRESGVRPGDRVALMLPGGTDAVVAMVASLMTDAVYVPIDPEYPQARIDLIVESTQPAVVVNPGLELSVGAGHGVAEPIPGAAYIIHTSGSTGAPKGVVVTRSNVAAMLGAALDEVEAGPDDVWSWVHSYAFDFSVWEIFGALASGGCVVAVDRATARDPRRLAATLDRYGVTILSQTPTAFSALTDPAVVGAGVLSSVRAVVFGGEALEPKGLRGFVEGRGLDTSSPSGSDYSTDDKGGKADRDAPGKPGSAGFDTPSASASGYSTGEGGSGYLVGEGETLRDAPSQARSLLRDQGGDAGFDTPSASASGYSTSERGGSDYSIGGSSGLRLINMYGITETTVHLTACDVDLDDERSIIGAPLDGVGWAILDSRMRPVPPGAAGDLYVAGDQVSLGYLNAPALTATRFVADPVGGGRRMYRTGDRVREVAPGRPAYLGRDDDQVQIRGYRIELGEIASVLRAIPGVGNARVLVDPGQNAGDERLIAFITEDGFADRADVSALTETMMLAACSARLPAYAVPARAIIVDGFPRTPTGKLDRDKLLAGLRESMTPVRPLTPTEEIVAAAMRTVIGDDSVDLTPESNFFATGGTSLSAARLAAALAADGHPVAVPDVFDRPTVAGLAELLTGATEVAMPELGERRVEPEHLPLTPEQLDVWLRWRTQPEFTGYLMHVAVPVEAPVEQVRDAVAAVVGRHDALRTSFPVHDGSPFQNRWSDEELAMFVRGQLDADVDSALDVSDVLESLLRPIDLGETLPWQVRVIEREGQTWLLIVGHHIATDGESFPILLDELSAELDGQPGSAGDRVDYRQYGLWRDDVVRVRRDELVAHWSSAFGEPVSPLRLPEVNLPTAGDVTPADVSVVQAHGELDDSVTGALDALAVERKSTAFIVVHAALAAVLARQSDTSVVTIGTAVSGRLDARLARVPGLFARALPLHTVVDLELPFGELLSRVTEVDLGAFAHADLPLTEIAEIADPGRAGAGTPLFEVSLGVVPDEVAAMVGGSGSGSGVSIRPRLAPRATQPAGGEAPRATQPAVGDPARALRDAPSQAPALLRDQVPLFGIDVAMYRVDGRLQISMTCTDRVADAERLDALCRLVVDTLERAVAEADRPTAALLAGTSEVARPAPPAETLAELLGAGLADAPDAVAVVEDGDVLTNADLDRMSTAIARQLIAAGVGPGDVVVQHLPRSTWGVVATLAVARAGVAFVNVDPADPAERRRSLIERAQPAAILALGEHTLPPIDTSTTVLRVDQLDTDVSEPFDPVERVRPLRVDDAAYITFTSGTTGTPKGVVVTHRGLAGWARDTTQRLQITAADRVLHTYAVGFDAQLMGLLPARLVGASIVICPPTVIAADELRDTITDHAVTRLFTTPSVLATLHPGELPDVRHIAVGGEALSGGLVRDWTAVAAVSNEYGPTEATVAVTSARFTEPGPVTIGTPLAGVTAHVLDAQLRPVPVHTVGELYVSGACLARGYLGESGRTASAFVADPSGSGERMYRTGDLVHRRPDGTLVIHGRTDDQVKIRGIRLEPSEIDVALTRLPEVATAVTATRATTSGEKVLVSWVVPEPGHAVVADELREALSHVLPRSIIPVSFVEVAALPIGRNGKVDLVQLPEPDIAGRDVAVDEPLTTATEHLVVEAWADVLETNLDSFGATADFFTAGGTSLSATRATARLTAACGVDVPVRVLFEARTVRAVAERIDELRGADTGPAPAPLPIPDHLPLAHPQRRMWIHHHYAPRSTAYHVPVVIRIDGDIDLARLQHAVDAVVDTHAVLRTTYPDGPAGPVQRIIERSGPVLGHETVDAGAIRPAIETFLSIPFDLEHEPGFRARVIDADGARYFVAALHHIAIDGWSMRILLADLLRAYQGELLDSALSYADFTQWQMQRLGGPDDPTSRYTRELDHWLGVLDGAGEPVRLPGRSDVEGDAGRVSARMDRAVAEGLRQTADRLSATVFHLAHAALADLLGQWTGRWDVVVGVPVHGRSNPAWESVVGMFVNTVALRTQLTAGDAIGMVVEQVRDVALDAADHAEVPYDAVARAVRPNAHAGYDPLISVLLVNEDVLPTVSGDALGANAWQASVVDEAIATVDAKFDIEVVLAEDDGELVVTVVHSGYVPGEVAQAFLADFVTLFVAAAGDVAVSFPRVRTGAVVGSESAGVVTPVAASTDAELVRQVAGVMAEVLDVPVTDIGVRDDFFTIGGTSLSATRVTSTLGRELGVRVPTRVLFENPSAEELAGALRDTRLAPRSSGSGGDDASLPTPEARRVDEPTPFPEVRGAQRRATKGGDGDDLRDTRLAPRSSGTRKLAPTQRRMWVNAQLLGETPIYGVPVVVAVPEGATAGRVIGAVNEIVDRHAALRTQFLSTADGPRQQVIEGWRPEIRHIAAEALAENAAEFTESFDLEAAPPVRAWVIESDAAPVAVVIVAHHIVLDGESADILADELTVLMAGMALNPPHTGFDDVAARLAAEDEQSREENLRFWADVLDGYSGQLELVADRPLVRDLRTATAEFDLDGDVSAAVATAAEREHASEFHVLHAGLALALGVQAGTDDVALATPVSMRRDAGTAGTVGMLTSTVVLRTRLDAASRMDDLIRQVRDADLAAIDHGLIAFDDVVALVDPPREPGRHPLVQVAFSMAFGAAASWEGMAGGLLEERSEFDLHVVAVEHEGRWRLRLEYARGLFDDDAIALIGRRVVAGIGAVVGDSSVRVSSVGLLDVREFGFLERVGGSAVVGRVDRGASRGRIETSEGGVAGSRYASSPSGSEATRPAVGGAVGGGALRDAPSQARSLLRDQGGLLGELLGTAVATYPDNVAVADARRELTYREFDGWVSVAARALRARGLGRGDVVAVAIPRSVESVVALWSVTRIGATCVPVDVTYPAARLERVVEVTGAAVIGPEDVPDQPTEDVVSEPLTRVSPDELAYVITTSGTTGTPNVVGVPHRGVHRVAELGDVIGTDRVGIAISPGFDATFHDMLLPLTTGATLVVVPAEIAGGRDLTDFLRAQRVSVFTATPSVMRTLTAADLTALRAVYIGGEALTTDLADTWAGAAQVINIYGPTETTVTVSTSRYAPGARIRIGRPRPGIGALLLDRQLRPTPPGVVGELYIAGTGVARGYLGDAALTASRFVAGPDGERLYRTGDLMRWDVATEELVYVGRADRQIKIRGQRVEPAEIDAVLVAAGATRAATVLRDSPAGPALVSYVVAPDVPADQLWAHCRRTLPRHMVPSRIVPIPELPLSGAGKLDAKRLPEPEWSTSRRTPDDAVQQAIVDAFAEVLGVEVGMDDDFFAAGGNSLALLSLRDTLMRNGIEVSAAELFTHPTPGEIALLHRSPVRGNDRVVRLSETTDGSPVWCVHTAAGIVEQFRPLADALSAPVFGLQLPELIDPALQMPQTLPELVARHVAAIRDVQEHGPYRLVGWSLGGLIAHEIARQLVDAGENVTQLVLLDPRTPAELRGVPDDELRAEHPLRAAAEQRDPEAVRRFDERSATMVQTARDHALAPLAIGRTLYVAASDNPDPDAWGRAAGPVDVVAGNATHADLGEPETLRRIAQLLEEEL
ncbi:amino acid adenylation domain-containing protein [Gordonia sp. LSe1-13]|uniref:Amino acid adenylation domain-containing protein n=1 Tax=Gordonia sesuvii TaxID=3116777 RepID=A0ABU7ME16_9ACTN|nr:amino acid adenylation domain-containing protein [Gordonia sp. LSe1-13]